MKWNLSAVSTRSSGIGYVWLEFERIDEPARVSG